MFNMLYKIVSRCVVFYLFSSVFLRSQVQAGDEELSVLIGIPVMEDLRELSESRIIFDKEDGRIVETVFEGNASASDVSAFYHSSLYQLGWALERETAQLMVFSRENESILIEYEPVQPLRVRFRLGPND